MSKLILYVTMLLMATVTSLFAQNDTASLSGTVFSTDGTAFQDAVVYLHLPDSTLVKTEITDEKGSFFYQD